MKNPFYLALSALLVVAIVTVVLAYNQNDSEETSTNSIRSEITRCNTDDDCIVAGCSSNLCILSSDAETVVSTCEFRDEYACLKKDNCICQNNRCNWEGNEKYTACVESLDNTPCQGLIGDNYKACLRGTI